MTDSTLASLSRALGPKYEVRRLVGSGGFAEVYEVWDKELERRLAIKVLRPDVAWTSGMIERFQRETRAAARLSIPTSCRSISSEQGKDSSTTRCHSWTGCRSANC